MPAAHPNGNPIRAASGLPAASCDCCPGTTDPNPPNPGCCIGPRVDSSVTLTISAPSCGSCLSVNWPSTTNRSVVQCDFQPVNGTWEIPLVTPGPFACVWSRTIPNIIPFRFRNPATVGDCSNLPNSSVCDLYLQYQIIRGQEENIFVAASKTGFNLGDGFLIGIYCHAQTGLTPNCYGSTTFPANPTACCANQLNAPPCKTCTLRGGISAFPNVYSPGASCSIIRGAAGFAEGFGPEDFA